MQVRVLFFGALRDLSGRATDSLSLPEGSTLADLVSHYEQKIPKLKQFLPSIALSLNQQYAQADSVLHDQDEVALLPPVSGGNSAPEREILPERGFLTRERIRTDELARALQKPEDGAVVVFEGVVRNNTRGRRTLVSRLRSLRSDGRAGAAKARRSGLREVRGSRGADCRIASGGWRLARPAWRSLFVRRIAEPLSTRAAGLSIH